MGNPRATFAKSAIDRTVAAEVGTAHRALERAIAACRKASRDDKQPSGRVARVQRDLNRARGALGRVGKVTPGWDPNDPDFESEESRGDRRRAEWAEKDRIKAEEKKAAEDAERAEEAERAAEAAEESD